MESREIISCKGGVDGLWCSFTMKQKTSITDIITKFREIHGDRYEYDISSYVNMKTPMSMICKNHGEFKRTPSDHTRLKHGCRKCGWEETGKAKRISWETFLEKANTLHNNKYEYVQPEEFTGYDCLIEMKCPTHGTFKQKVKYHLMDSGCPACGRMKCNIKVINRTGETAHGMYTLEEYLSTIPEEHRNKHDYSLTVYKGKDHKLTIRCKEHDCIYEQYPRHHRENGTACKTCIRNYKRNVTPASLFWQRCELKHGKMFIYDETSYTGSHGYIKYTCSICGAENSQLAYSHENLGNTCAFCKGSRQEREINDFLQNTLGVNFIKNDRKILDGQELDFFLPDYNVAIEHNGTFFHSEIAGEKDRFYHIDKTNNCLKQNIKLIHIFEDEWKFKSDICKSIISHKLGKTARRIYARQCIIKEIEHDVKNEFLHYNHIQGEDQSRFKYGLYHNDELVSVMTFSVPRYNNAIQWELSRFCNKQNIAVIGGASKLLSHFKKEHTPSSIVSYADRRWSDGGIYHSLDFKLEHKNYRPQYYYLNKSNYLVREHRSNYTKQKIAIKYPEINQEGLQEWDIMQSLNYDRIWDSGVMTFIWKKENPLN